MVACVAGIGASAAFKLEVGSNVAATDEPAVAAHTKNGAPTYAAELFGPGSAGQPVSYPTYSASAGFGGTPTVRMYFMHDNDQNAVLANGQIDVTFGFTEGAKIHGTVQASDFTQWGDGDTAHQPTIVDGGTDGDSSVTVRYGSGTAPLSTAGVRKSDTTDGIVFTIPRLKNLGALADNDKVVRVWASVKVVSGSISAGDSNLTAFPTGLQPMAARPDAPPVIYSAQAVDLKAADSMANVGDSAARIDIDDRTMLRANAWSGAFGYTAADPYNPNTFSVDGEKPAARLLDLMLTVRSRVPAMAGCAKTKTVIMGGGDSNDQINGAVISEQPDTTGCLPGATILQWDGTRVDSDLAGVLDVDVTGDRGLFRDGDQVFVNFGEPAAGLWASGYAGAATVRRIDAGETLTVDGNMASFTVGGLSIDPGNVDEGTAQLPRRIAVLYIPAGKEDLAHGTMLHASAVVNYTRPTTADERAVRRMTELRIHGVDHELKAYAIPFAGNGKGDKGNIRIRCESGDAFSDGKECRAFLECWNDMGERDFGEVTPPIDANALTVLSSDDVGMIAGMMTDMTRYSCRVLATGQPSVQQLTRDGSSGTLVNNTYVEDM